MNAHVLQSHRRARHRANAAASEEQETQQQLMALSFIGSLMHRLMRMQSVRCKRAASVGGSLLAQWLDQALREWWQIMANLTRKSAFLLCHLSLIRTPQRTGPNALQAPATLPKVEVIRRHILRALKIQLKKHPIQKHIDIFNQMTTTK